MYSEFVFIYVALAVLLVLVICIFVMQIIVLNRIKRTFSSHAVNVQTMNRNAITNGNVVFCKVCATQYDAYLKRCPKCGAIR